MIMKIHISAVSRIMSKKEHTISASVIEIIALESLTDDLIGQVCAIHVSGLDEIISKDLLECYFESERRSGGTDIEELFFEEANAAAVITYGSPTSKLGSWTLHTYRFGGH